MRELGIGGAGREARHAGSADPACGHHVDVLGPRENRTAITDAEGHTTYFTYDLYGNLVATADPIGKDAAYV